VRRTAGLKSYPDTCRVARRSGDSMSNPTLSPKLKTNGQLLRKNGAPGRSIEYQMDRFFAAVLEKNGKWKPICLQHGDEQVKGVCRDYTL
jgi:hypothetical protein